MAEVEDAEREVTWHAFLFDKKFLALAPEHQATLQRDLKNHTRHLFETSWAGNEIPNRMRMKEPRTAGPDGWSPLLEATCLDLGGPALRVVHAMYYEPTLDIYMGHLLAPVERGLIELRATAGSRQTGARESGLLLKLSQEAGVTDLEAFMKDRTFDPLSAVHDSLFPEHPLSRLRSALDACELRITKPGHYASEGDVSPLAGAITPPPRFVPVGPVAAPAARAFQFERLSFAGTDGIDRLVVYEVRVAATDLATTAELLTHRFHERLDRTTIRIVEHLVEERSRLLVVDSRSGAERLRTVMAWFMAPGDVVWCVAIWSTHGQPVEVLLDELRPCVASWRAVSRPWWKRLFA